MIATPKGFGVDSMYPMIMMLAVGLEHTPLALREGRQHDQTTASATVTFPEQLNDGSRAYVCVFRSPFFRASSHRKPMPLKI
jgi:hypothetical protein